MAASTESLAELDDDRFDAFFAAEPELVLPDRRWGRPLLLRAVGLTVFLTLAGGVAAAVQRATG